MRDYTKARDNTAAITEAPAVQPGDKTTVSPASVRGNARTPQVNVTVFNQTGSNVAVSTNAGAAG